MPTKFNINGHEIDGSQQVFKWIQEGLDKEAISYAEAFGKCLAKDKKSKNKEEKYSALTTSQIRNFYGEVVRMRMRGFDRNRFLLMKPRLVYATSRNETDGSRDFLAVFKRAIDAVLEADNEEKAKEYFQRFADFFEAVLAYHRAHGGK